MKTETKSQILKFIDKNKKVRPIELVQSLNVSHQAIHRHLKHFVQRGVLETRGRAPFTQYVLAGMPDFSKALDWFTIKKINQSPKEFVCETRDVFWARLSSLKNLIKNGLPPDDLPLLESAIGEIGNNSFDHNLGKWRDVPGCWFEMQTTQKKLWICIADRGQGMLGSLHRVDPTIVDDQTALKLAFERRLSGRSPERRGNGLKYVKNVILQDSSRGLACYSGLGKIFLGDWAGDFHKVISRQFSKNVGTLTLVVWRLQ